MSQIYSQNSSVYLFINNIYSVSQLLDQEHYLHVSQMRSCFHSVGLSVQPASDLGGQIKNDKMQIALFSIFRLSSGNNVFSFVVQTLISWRVRCVWGLLASQPLLPPAHGALGAPTAFN